MATNKEGNLIVPITKYIIQSTTNNETENETTKGCPSAYECCDIVTLDAASVSMTTDSDEGVVRRVESVINEVADNMEDGIPLQNSEKDEDAVVQSVISHTSSEDEPDGKFGRLIRLSSKRNLESKLKDDSDVLYKYNMSHERRGDFVIINNKTFDPKLKMGERAGTDEDAKSLFKTFERLGFTILYYKDLKPKEMMKVMLTESRKDHSNADCFACAILSHGEEGVVYGTDGHIPIEDLMAPFKGCLDLIGKPKLFFIQACRGMQLDYGIEFQCDGLSSDDDEVDSKPPQQMQRIPVEADFLFAYSTVPGYLSWRNSQNGSWFIQTLCGVINTMSQSKDLLQILTRTNYLVAYLFESQNTEDPIFHKKKQIPSIVSMLTKELIFGKK